MLGPGAWANTCAQSTILSWQHHVTSEPSGCTRRSATAWATIMRGRVCTRGNWRLAQRWQVARPICLNNKARCSTIRFCVHTLRRYGRHTSAHERTRPAATWWLDHPRTAVDVEQVSSLSRATRYCFVRFGHIVLATDGNCQRTRVQAPRGDNKDANFRIYKTCAWRV